MGKIIKKIIIIVFLLLFTLPLELQAATLYLDPVSKKISPEDTLELKVKIGVIGRNECINTVNVDLNFPKDVLEVKDFNSGESILSLWVKKPELSILDKINKEGRVAFAGGIPGGYCGKIPGDVGDSNILGSIIFKVKKPVIFHKANISFSSESKVFLHDGLGTLAPIKTQGASFEIDEKKAPEEDPWEKKLLEDNIAPESFIIEINRAPNVWDNQYFIVFFTTDKQTGIDRYEVLEASPYELLDSLKRKNIVKEWAKDLLGVEEISLFWQEAKSPYLLKDQGLNSVIIIKAVDKAENERIVEYENEALEFLRSPKKDYSLTILIISIAILLLLLLLLLLVKFKKKENNPNIKNKDNPDSI